MCSWCLSLANSPRFEHGSQATISSLGVLTSFGQQLWQNFEDGNIAEVVDKIAFDLPEKVGN